MFKKTAPSLSNNKVLKTNQQKLSPTTINMRINNTKPTLDIIQSSNKIVIKKRIQKIFLSIKYSKKAIKNHKQKQYNIQCYISNKDQI